MQGASCSCSKLHMPLSTKGCIRQVLLNQLYPMHSASAANSKPRQLPYYTNGKDCSIEHWLKAYSPSKR